MIGCKRRVLAYPKILEWPSYADPKKDGVRKILDAECYNVEIIRNYTERSLVLPE